MQRKPLTTDNATIRLESLCARSEHCTSEITAKLRNWGIGGSDAEKIINHLTANRFVDDLRFARSFVRDRYRFYGYGRRKIAIALAAKRIDRGIIEEALAEIDDETYLEILTRLLSRKAQAVDISQYEGRNKLYRYAISRGYESDITARVLKSLVSKD